MNYGHIFSRIVFLLCKVINFTDQYALFYIMLFAEFNKIINVNELTW